MLCEKCHKELGDDSKFCNFCGFNLVEKEKENSVEPYNYSKLFIIIGIGFSIVAATIIFGFGLT